MGGATSGSENNNDIGKNQEDGVAKVKILKDPIGK